MYPDWLQRPGAGAPGLCGEGAEPVGEEGAQEPQLDVHGAGPVPRQAQVSE